MQSYDPLSHFLAGQKGTPVEELTSNLHALIRKFPEEPHSMADYRRWLGLDKDPQGDSLLFAAVGELCRRGVVQVDRQEDGSELLRLVAGRTRA